MEQRQIERHLLRVRLLITRSAVHRLGFRTMEDVQENRVAFFHECHAVFKKALKLLVDDMLEVERLVEKIQGHTDAEKQLKAKYRYWLLILELAYDSFVWTAANHDRSEVTKYYKGPKHGALVHQNIHSVIGLAEQLNQEPNVFAFPLDFCRFTCITDLLRIRLTPTGEFPKISSRSRKERSTTKYSSSSKPGTPIAISHSSTSTGKRASPKSSAW